MAYLDLSETHSSGATAMVSARALASACFAPLAQVAAEAEAGLTALEHRIIDLARGEGLKSLRAPRPRSWLGTLILGPTPPSKVLANEKLEALRRLAVQAWHHGYTLPISAAREAKRLGYSESQIGAVIDLVGRARTPVRRIGA